MFLGFGALAARGSTYQELGEGESVIWGAKEAQTFDRLLLLLPSEQLNEA
jgi:hypothetical protein